MGTNRSSILNAMPGCSANTWSATAKLLGALALHGWLASAAPGATRTWSNTGTGSWFLGGAGGNWSTAAVPTSADDPKMLNGGTATIATGANAAARTLEIGGNPTGIGNLQVSSGALTVTDYNLASGFLFVLRKGSTYTQNGGTATFGPAGAANGVLIGGAGPSGVATFTLSAGGVEVGNVLKIASASHAGTVNLDGGTLGTRQVASNGGTCTFNFNGGTLAARVDQATFMTGLTAANVKAGGALIDTAGFDITIGQALLPGTPSGGLTKSGNGTLTLTGANTYTGNTVVNGGTLVAAATTALPGYGTAGKVTANSGGTLAIRYGGAGEWTSANLGSLLVNATFSTGSFLGLEMATGATYGTAIAGNQGLVKTGAATLTLSGANTYAGPTTLAGGALLVQHATALGGTGGGTTVAAGARLLLDNGITVTGETLTINGDGGSGSSYDGALKANTGATAEWAGTVILGNSTARVGAGSSATTVLSGDIQNGAFANLHICSTAGKIELGGSTKSYTGATRIIRGTLKLRAGNLLPAGTTLDVDYSGTDEDAVFDLAGFSQTVGALKRSGSGSGTGASTVTSSAAGGALTVNQSVDTAFDGVIAGTLTLKKDGAGTLTLAGASTFSGATTVADGTLKLDGGDNRLPTDQTVNLGHAGDTGAATLDLNGRNQQVPGLTALGSTMPMSVTSSAGATGTLTINNSVHFTYAGTLDGNLALTKTGTHELALTGANTFSGAATVSDGVLRISNPLALGTTAGSTTVASGARLELAGGITVSGETVTIVGTGGNNIGALQSYSGANTWDGPVTLGANAARIGANGAGTSLTVAGAVGDGANTYDLAIRNADGGGAVVLSGTSTYGGDTLIVVGLCKLDGGDNRLPIGTVLTIGNSVNSQTATFDLNGHNQEVGGLTYAGTTMAKTVTATGGGTLTVNQADNRTYIGNLSGALALTKAGAGTLTLSGANTYTGVTTVNGGTLKLGAVDGVPAYADVVLNGGTTAGTLDLNGFDKTFQRLSGTTGAALGQVVNNGAGAITLTLGYNSVSSAFAGRLRNNTGTGGTLALVKTGTGTVALSGPNTYTGATEIRNGALEVTLLGNSGEAASSLGTPTGGNRTIVLGYGGGASGVLVYTGGATTTDHPITLHASAGGGCGLKASGAGTLTWNGNVGGPHSFTLGGTGVGEMGGAIGITAGSLQKADAGTWVLRGANTYTVTTWLNGGVLALGADNVLSTATVYLNGGTLASDGAGARALDNSLTLNASSSLGEASGGTGNLTLGGDFDIGTIPKTLTVYNRSTLTGAVSGTAGGSFTKAGPGTLVLTHANTYAGTTAITAGTLLVNAAHTGGGAYALSGTSTLGGAGSTDSAVTLDSPASLSPGEATTPAIFTVNNAVTLRNGTFLRLNINGPDAGTGYDQLIVTGALQLTDATLIVDVSPEYVPPMDTVFTIIKDFSNLTGTFAGLPEGRELSCGSTGFVVHYDNLAKTVTLTARSTGNGTIFDIR